MLSIVRKPKNMLNTFGKILRYEYGLPKIHGRAVVCGNVTRVLQEHHDYGDVVGGTLPLGLHDQTLRHRLQVICTKQTHNYSKYWAQLQSWNKHVLSVLPEKQRPIKILLGIVSTAKNTLTTDRIS